MAAIDGFLGALPGEACLGRPLGTGAVTPEVKPPS